MSTGTRSLPSCASSAPPEDDHFYLRGGRFPAHGGSASMTVSTAQEKGASAVPQHHWPPPPQTRHPDFQRVPPTGPGKGKCFLQEVLQPLRTFNSRLQFHPPNSFCNLLKVSSISVTSQAVCTGQFLPPSRSDPFHPCPGISCPTLPEKRGKMAKEIPKSDGEPQEAK